MSDERHFNRLAAFLVGFVVGALLATGGTAGYMHAQNQQLRSELKMMGLLRAEAHGLLEELVDTRQKLREAREELERVKGGEKP